MISTLFFWIHYPIMNSHIVLGLCRIAGITTLGVTQADAEGTLAAAIDSGIGNSIRRSVTVSRVSAIACWDDLFAKNRKSAIKSLAKLDNDGCRMELASTTARKDADRRREESLGVDYFDTLMLHTPDPHVPLEESARAILGLQNRGLCRRIGVCSVTLDQFNQFASIVDCRLCSVR